MQEKVLSALSAILLALTYFVAGFAVCAGVPGVTEQLAMRCSEADLSPFEHPELTQLAVATRDYTVGSHDLDALTDAIADANSKAATPYAGSSAEELLSEVPDAYTLDEEAIAHLDDVNEVTSRFLMPILGIAVLAGFCIMGAWRMFGSEPIARALIGAGVAVLVAFAVLGAWASFGFNSLFASMHALFFENGTWQFPVDSLLICMYPQAFWVGMGVVWLSTSCVLAALSIAGGAIMLHRRKRASAAGPAAHDGATPPADAARPTGDSRS